jgi:hypothetical protein
MKRNSTEVRTKKLFLLGVMFLMQFCSAYAQAIAPTQPLPTQPSKQRESSPKFVPDPKADKYKFVFLRTEPGRLGYSYEDHIKYSDELKIRRDNFIDALNKVSEQGYRALPFWTTGFSLVQLSDQQYEYTQTETESAYINTKGNAFEGRFRDLERKGFLTIAHTSWSLCDNPPVIVGEMYSPSCQGYDRMLLERTKTFAQSNQFLLAYSGPGAPNAEVLTKVVKEGLALGFTPTHIFSPFKILMQKNIPQREFAPDMSETLVIFSKSEKKFRLRINELAAQGFQLALYNYGTALMYRPKNGATPLSYVWIDAKKKDFEQQFLALQAKGASFKMTYPNRVGEESNLMFEQSGTGDYKRREYKVLKFELNSVEFLVARKVQSELTPASIESLKELNRLAQDGFEARTVFISDSSGGFEKYKFNLLLERKITVPDKVR